MNVISEKVFKTPMGSIKVKDPLAAPKAAMKKASDAMRKKADAMHKAVAHGMPRSLLAKNDVEIVVRPVVVAPGHHHHHHRFCGLIACWDRRRLMSFFGL